MLVSSCSLILDPEQPESTITGKLCCYQMQTGAADHRNSGTRLCAPLASALPPGWPENLGGPGLPFVLFLLCGFRLFGILLPLPFGLNLLAFLVAHVMVPF